MERVKERCRLEPLVETMTHAIQPPLICWSLSSPAVARLVSPPPQLAEVARLEGWLWQTPGGPGPYKWAYPTGPGCYPGYWAPLPPPVDPPPIGVTFDRNPDKLAFFLN